MAASVVFTRYITKLKFSFLKFPFKRFYSEATVCPEIHNNSDATDKVSTLFVPGRYGAEVYQIVKPVIDIEHITVNLERIKYSCNHREINLDLDYVLEVAKEWLKIKNDYLDMDEKHKKFIFEIDRLSKLSFREKLSEVQNEREKHLLTVITVKEKLHNIEDVFMPLIEKIPHDLHPDTPLNCNKIEMCQELPTLTIDVKSHTEIAKSLSAFKCNGFHPVSYFMTGKLAELDLAIQMYFMEKLNNLGFFALAGIDFCKSFIVEAIGNNPYSNDDSILIKGKINREIGQKLHVVGGASFEALCAYHTNMNVDKSTLPARYFALGRKYNANNRNNNLHNLFSVVQSTNVHSLILSENNSSNAFEMLFQMIKECYSELNIPYRVVNIAAKHLTIAESQRKQLELWSPALQDYIPIAYVSQHDDFISKRLNITYGVQYHKEGYCHIVEGSIVNISVLIGCIVENFQTKDNFNIPTIFKKYLFSE